MEQAGSVVVYASSAVLVFEVLAYSAWLLSGKCTELRKLLAELALLLRDIWKQLPATHESKQAKISRLVQVKHLKTCQIWCFATAPLALLAAMANLLWIYLGGNNTAEAAAGAGLFVTLAVCSTLSIFAVLPEYLTRSTAFLAHLFVYIAVASSYWAVRGNSVQFVVAELWYAGLRLAVALTAIPVEGNVGGSLEIGLSCATLLISMTSSSAFMMFPSVCSFEFVELIIIFMVQHIAVEARQTKVSSAMEIKEARNASAASASFLAVTCDAVVHLSKNFVITSPSPQLAAMLSKGNSSEALDGSRFLEYLSEDAERNNFVDFINQDDKLNVARAFTTNLKDSDSKLVSVSLFQARCLDADDEEFHLIGIQEKSPETREPAEASQARTLANISGQQKRVLAFSDYGSDDSSRSGSLLLDPEEPVTLTYDTKFEFMEQPDELKRLLNLKLGGDCVLKDLFVSSEQFESFKNWHRDKVEQLVSSELETPHVDVFGPMIWKGRANVSPLKKHKYIEVMVRVSFEDSYDTFGSEAEFECLLIRCRQLKHYSKVSRPKASRSQGVLPRQQSMLAL
eukprot:TRINITY_DN102521_c0_g1_i1.p1 TRINITY_DN102521_c0_g1~~TRINITY_DN102521_c0_g1_i1.p1  ORF type:complete len:578 (+),score=95.56 TRINITY_DN102521_c0_g1_i1:30-1736(+)